MKSLLVFIICALCGCVHPTKKQKIQPNTNSPVINKAPILIEINNVPPPFDVAGNFPYVLWINGMYISNPDHKALHEIINKIGEDRIPGINPKDIHNGWIQPRFVKKYIEEQLKITQ
jgi:hypothetical protein|tara:strand:+ start:1776 stop:2126 length:351 start_codon:yes stop_codon:yes gene_type:complete